MTEPVATVEPNPPHAANLRPTEVGGAPPPPSGTRFAYPSGSTPLEGFTIKRGVGHGGFGEVYYALSDAGKEVALKLIRRNLDVELRGIRHCLNLKHPNLLSVFDIRHDQTGDNWVVMEFITGQSLEEAVAAHPQGMPQVDALAWFFGIGGGVACLHDHGIVHRDLKPGNIFCDEGVVKLGDYGLSKFISCSRRSGHTESVGTVHYMAPEIANGRYGKEIDIYALGVILYEMLTGRVPFEGESVGEVLMKHLTTPPDVSMLAEPFRSVVAKAMEKDPAKRFASVPEMLAALPRPARVEVQMGPLPTGATKHGPQADSGGSHEHAAAAAAGAAGSAGIGDEPIYRAARRLWHHGRDAWRGNRLPTRHKIILLVVVAIVLVSNAPWVAAAATILLLLYACYFTVRAFVLAHQTRRQSRVPQETVLPSAAGGPGSPGASPEGQAGAMAEGSAPTGVWRPAERPRWAPRRLGKRELAAEILRQKSPRQRIVELFGSLLGGTVVALITALVVQVLFAFWDTRSGPEVWGMQQWGQYAWLALVTIAGVWTVMIPSKLWEGAEGDVMLRRFIFLVIGVGAGMLAIAVLSFLAVDLPHARHSEMFPSHLADRTIRASDPWPSLKYTLAAFATLFALIRWWRLADPLRSTRLSLWSLFVCGLLAWLIADFWSFPLPWLPMVACAMSVSIQLSSPWLSPDQRRLRS